MAEQSHPIKAAERDVLCEIPLSRIVVPDDLNPRGEVTEDAELDALAETIRQRGVDYAGVLRAAGGSIDIVDLPDGGLKGNSHMLMMDKNNGAIADLIQKWLVSKGLVD